MLYIVTAAAYRYEVIMEDAETKPFVYLFYLNVFIALLQAIAAISLQYTARFTVSNRELGRILGIPENCCYCQNFYRTQIISMVLDTDPIISKDFSKELRDRGVEVRVVDQHSIVRSHNMV